MRQRGPDLLRRVHAVFARRRPLTVDTNFFEAGFSSATLAETLADLRDLGLSLSLVDLYRYPTVRQLAALGDPPAATAATPPWLRPPRG